MRVKDELQIDKRKNEILHHAITILLEEGIDQLSIRKIATRMNQSPGIIYHYYENKEMILRTIVEDGYQHILQAIQSCANISEPKERLQAILHAYMNAMFEKKELFLLLMNSKDSEIKKKTDILCEDAFERSSIRTLYKEIDEGVKSGLFECEDCYRKTQWIWCATYGVITRMIQEQVSITQKDLLIQEHITSIMKSLER